MVVIDWLNRPTADYLKSSAIESGIRKLALSELISSVGSSTSARVFLNNGMIVYLINRSKQKSKSRNVIANRAHASIFKTLVWHNSYKSRSVNLGADKRHSFCTLYLFKQAFYNLYIHIGEGKDISRTSSMLVSANKKSSPRIESLLAYYETSSLLIVLIAMRRPSRWLWFANKR